MGSQRITDRQILEIVVREMQAYGAAWRADWSSFDGRSLENQLDGIARFAEQALEGRAIDYTEGSDFLEYHSCP